MKSLLTIIAVSLFVCLSMSQEYKLEASSNRNWKLKCQEKADFSVRLLYRENSKSAYKEVKGRKISYAVRTDGIQRAAGTIITGDQNSCVQYSLPQPGWINVKFTLLDDAGKEYEYKDKNGKKKKVTAGIGALVEPEKFQPGFEKPADFDAFWDEQRKILDKVPFNAKLTEVEPSAPQKGKFHCYDLQLDCAGGTPVSGYLSIPIDAKPKSLPAIVSFHGAGYYSANKSRNKFPAIYLDINAHGLPNGKTREFYNQYGRKNLPRYWHKGAESRETFYFRGMYFRAMRALDYVKSRPEWNGRVLVVSGSSMGGAQSLAAAGLDKDVTLCLVSVPAMCDHGGSIAKPTRAAGWPTLFDARRRKPDPKRLKTAPYYDNIFFADRMKCEVRMTAGLNDFICCPSSIYAVYNRLKSNGRKCDIEIFPVGDHSHAFAVKGRARFREHIKE